MHLITQKIKMNLSQINTKSIEGRLLIAALSALTVSPVIHLNGKELDGRQMQPDEVLEEVVAVEEFIYKDNPLPEAVAECTTVLHELEKLVNKYSLESNSDTPDFVLAKFIEASLNAYADAVQARDKFFGVSMWEPSATESKWVN